MPGGIPPADADQALRHGHGKSLCDRAIPIISFFIQPSILRAKPRFINSTVYEEAYFISKHRLQLEHDFDWNNIEILDEEPCYNKRLISEMFFILKNKKQS